MELAPYEITILQELLRNERRQKEVWLNNVHENHFPDTVRGKNVKQITVEDISYCHNRWCRLGQINILLDKLEIEQTKINESFTIPSYGKIVHPNKKLESEKLQEELEKKIKEG